MHLIEKEGGIVEYVLDDNESKENHEFLAKIASYKMIRQGSGIFIYNKADGKLVSYFNPFDNTQFVCDVSGYSVAAELGTKRFPIGSARLALDEKEASEVKAIKFARDLSFPLRSSKEERVTSFKVVTLEELLEINNKNTNKLYNDLAELFNRCSDFTPGKKDEYLTGGKKEDKLCRFNLDNHKPRSGIVTDQIFLLDEKSNNKIVGTISATVSVNKDGIVDVYLYDEIVDYFTKLKPEELLKLQKIYSNTELSEDAKKEAIAKIIEPRRLELLEPLFAAARQKINQTIRRLRPGLSEHDLNEGIEKGMIRAFIRAADGRVPSYVKLNCGEKNSDIYVIHGPRTPYAAMLDSHVKNWASSKLNEIALTSRVNPSSQLNKYLEYGKWAGLGAIAALGAGLFAYRLYKGAPTLNAANVTTNTSKL